MWKKVTQDLDRWTKLNLSFLGRIASIKMNILPQFMFLFQNLPIIKDEKPFILWEREIFKFIWKGKKPRIKRIIMKDLKENGGLGVPDLKIYYYACALEWIRNWINLDDQDLLRLEGADLRYGWHGYLCYDRKEKHNDFVNHVVRKSLYSVWTKIKKKFYTKLPSWTSPQEAWGYGREQIQSTVRYKNLLRWEGDKPQIIPIQWYPGIRITQLTNFSGYEKIP